MLGPLGHCAPILGTVRHDGMACKKRASIVPMWRMMTNGHFHAATSVPIETDAPHGACVHQMTRAGPGGSPPDHMGGQDSTPHAMMTKLVGRVVRAVKLRQNDKAPRKRKRARNGKAELKVPTDIIDMSSD